MEVVESMSAAHGEFVSIPLLDTNEKYEIEDLVATEWFDDGAWEYAGQRKKSDTRQPADGAGP